MPAEVHPSLISEGMGDGTPLVETRIGIPLRVNWIEQKIYQSPADKESKGQEDESYWFDYSLHNVAHGLPIMVSKCLWTRSPPSCCQDEVVRSTW